MVINRRFVPINQDHDDLEQATYTGTALHRIGVWDLNVNAGFLPRTLDQLNSSQAVFEFEIVDAAVSSAVSIGGESTLVWASERIGRELVGEIAEDLRHNVVASRLQAIGTQVKCTFGLDLIVILNPDMIAFSEGEEIYWNYFSWSSEKVVIVSVADIREFANKAGRTFEVAITAMMLAQVIAEFFSPEGALFHREDRGCIFDFNERRETIVNTFKEMCIEPICLSTIPEPYRTAADKMVRTLKEIEPNRFVSVSSFEPEHQAQSFLDSDNLIKTSILIADYIEFGRLIMEWANDESIRPKSVAEFVGQLAGIATVPNHLQNTEFIDSIVELLLSMEIVEQIADVISGKESNSGGLPKAQFYDDIYLRDFQKIKSPIDKAFAIAAEEFASEK